MVVLPRPKPFVAAGPSVLALCWALGAVPAVAADPLFDLTEFPTDGRSVAGSIVDLDGDGRNDFFVVRITGMPPNEVRTVRVHLQRADGSFSEKPDHVRVLPDWSALFDVAELREDLPGAELLLLRPDRVTLMSLARADAPSVDLMVPGPTTLGAAADERGLERHPFVSREFGPEPWILVPQIGRITALTPDGVVRAQLEVPRRANYFVSQPAGMISVESEIQVFIDAPKIVVGDVDGDGRADLIAATRHEIRVYLRRADGSIGPEADRVHALGLVTKEDHIRGSGGLASEIKDFDADGRVDLVLSHVKGSMMDSKTRILVHRNHGDGWDLAAPDQTFETDASVGSNALYDLDGDGRLELVRTEVQMGVLEIVEILVSREIDVKMTAHQVGEDGKFDESPWFEQQFSLPVSFDTFRPKGFMPTARIDLNGDGRRDFVSGGNGTAIQIRLGNEKGLFSGPKAEQKVDTAGMIRFGDLDGDGLPDFLLVDPHHFDAPVRLGRNRGQLPGTAPRISAPGS